MSSSTDSHETTGERDWVLESLSCRKFKLKENWTLTTEHIRTEKTRGLWILVAPVTAQEHKEIFLLCHYFARRKKRINSNPPTSDKTNPPIHRRNTATLTMVQQTIRGNIDGVAYRPEVAPWGSRHKSGIESKDAIQGETNTLLPL